MTKLNSTYKNMFHIENKFCHLIRNLNENDIDIYGVVEVSKKMFEKVQT